jgi:hypothetical protein
MLVAVYRGNSIIDALGIAWRPLQSFVRRAIVVVQDQATGECCQVTVPETTPPGMYVNRCFGCAPVGFGDPIVCNVARLLYACRLGVLEAREGMSYTITDVTVVKSSPAIRCEPAQRGG